MKTVTVATLRSVLAQETDDVYAVLLTISHADLAQPIRVSNDAVDTLSRLETFVAYPFDMILPDDQIGSAPRASVTIDNVEKSIVDSLRSISSPADFLIEVVRVAAPDVVEFSYDQFQMRVVRADVFRVSGELSLEDFTVEPFPHLSFTPGKFRGLFG